MVPVQVGGGESSTFNNTFVGAGAGSGGFSSKLGDNNVCLGYDAGSGATGDNQLFIANNSSTTLIYGNFETEKVTIDDVLILTPRSSAPTNPVNGEIFVHTNNNIYCYLGGSWEQLNN
jgi:hypothetical protein